MDSATQPARSQEFRGQTGNVLKSNPRPSHVPALDPQSGPPIKGIIGSGKAMMEVYRITRQVARSNASVLLLGETGTGKELIAKAVHQLSLRGSGPFVR